MKLLIASVVFLCGCQLSLGMGYTKKWMDGEPDLVGVVRGTQVLYQNKRKTAKVEAYAEHQSSVPDQAEEKLEQIGLSLTVGRE